MTQNLFILIMSKIYLVSFWTIVGVYFYNHLLKSKSIYSSYILTKIHTLSFLKLASILFVFFFILIRLEYFIIDYLLDSMYYTNQNSSYINWLGEGNTNTTSNPNTSTSQTPITTAADKVSSAHSTTSTANPVPSDNNPPTTERVKYPRKVVSTPNLRSNAVDGAIMATAMASLFKTLPKNPQIGQIITVGAAGLLFGASGIVAKNFMGNASAHWGKRTQNFWPEDFQVEDILSGIIPLTGIVLPDLLNIILLLQKLQFIGILFIIYNLFLQLIDINKIEFYLLDHKPLLEKYVKATTLALIIKYLIKYLNHAKKGSKIFMIIFILLIIYCNRNSSIYLEFLINNLDQIIDTCYKN